MVKELACKPLQNSSWLAILSLRCQPDMIALPESQPAFNSSVEALGIMVVVQEKRRKVYAEAHRLLLKCDS